MNPIPSVPPPVDVLPVGLVETLLNVSLTGVILFRPVYDENGLAIIDLAYEHLNPAAQRMLQRPERPAETFLTLYPNAAQTGIFAFYRDTFLSGKANRYDVNYSYDGLDNYFQLSAQPCGPLLVVSFSDTAEQDRSPVEQALQAELLATTQRQVRERENFYQVFEQAPVIVALLRGPEHFFYYRNPAFQALFPGRPLAGRLYAEAMPEIVAAGLMAELDRVFATGETYYGTELPVITTPPDGSPPHQRYYDFSYQAYREDGQIVGISIFAYDVTSRVASRREADWQRRQLHNLFMEAPAPIVILDGPDLVFQLVNPAYQQTFPGRELRNKPLLEALPEVAGTPIHQILQQVYRSGETFVAQEMPLMLARHPGAALEAIYFTFTYQARRNSEGAVDGILVFAHEVTNQVQARRVVEESEQQAQAMAEELAAANEELQLANEEIQATNEELSLANERLKRSNVDLDTFVYTASHDLKSPVVSLDALLGRLANRLTSKLDSREEEMLALIQASSRRLQQTIRDLTQIAQVQRDVQEEKTLVQFSALLAEVQADLSSQLEEAGAQFTVDLGIESLAYPRKNLRSILYNLLSNALKYRSPELVPEIVITTLQQEGRTVLTISDNGLGLTEQQLQGMFAMFRRFHTHVEGSGVGLYTIKRIIENYGGQISVESQLGRGTTFQVLF